MFDEQTIRFTHTLDDEAQVLRVDKLLGADIAAFFDTSSSRGTQANMTFSMFGSGGANVQGFTSPACVRSWPPLGTSAAGPDRNLGQSDLSAFDSCTTVIHCSAGPLLP
ncbi:MAG: hypothetical protein OJF52_000339 [Nitrospira sp.]|nr:MAG: hypothetical protein OJF52_000339 [Nitrospira sp.]